MPAKTKDAMKFFASTSLTGKKTLFVIDSAMENVKMASRNLPFVTLLPYANLNTYDVSNTDVIVFAQEAAKRLSDHFMKGEKN
jgi:ribosomal protein L4